MCIILCTTCTTSSAFLISPVALDGLRQRKAKLQHFGMSALDVFQPVNGRPGLNSGAVGFVGRRPADVQETV